MIGVAEDISGSVDTRALAVPKPENAVELAFAPEFGLLTAPDRGGGEVLVQAGLKNDVARLEHLVDAQQRTFQACNRRAAVAGNVSRRVQTGAPVQFTSASAAGGRRPALPVSIWCGSVRSNLLSRLATRFGMGHLHSPGSAIISAPANEAN